MNKFTNYALGFAIGVWIGTAILKNSAEALNAFSEFNERHNRNKRQTIPTPKIWDELWDPSMDEC